MNNHGEIDILAFGAHPDDVELAAGGTILKHIALGKTVVIVDLTEGEMGTRGSREERLKEAKASSEVLGVLDRENLNLGDCFFEHGKTELLKVIEQVRRFRPKIVLCNSLSDRHPDHGRAGDLVSRACYLSGLRKIKTKWNNIEQESCRPHAIYHYIQDRWVDPDVIVDISDFFDIKLQSIMTYKSQFYDSKSNEPETPISSANFLKSIRARSISLGRYINADFGEGFNAERFIGINDLTTLL